MWVVVNNHLYMVCINWLSMGDKCFCCPLQLDFFCIPAFLGVAMATLGVCSSTPPTPPTASAEAKSEPFFLGLKKVSSRVEQGHCNEAVAGAEGDLSQATDIHELPQWSRGTAMKALSLPLM